MNIDKRIYLATGLSALVFGSALVLATPRDSFGDALTIDAETGAASRNGVLIRTDGSPRAGIVVSDTGGKGVRAPAQWLSKLNVEVPMDSVHLAAR